jgi:hypothetical protein
MRQENNTNQINAGKIKVGQKQKRFLPIDVHV